MEKRRQERDEVLEEFEKTGGYGGSVFWRKVKKSAVKGMKRLRNSSGKLVLEEKEMAKIAREHFKRNAQGTSGFHSEENGQPERQQRVKLEVEEIEKLEGPFPPLEVVSALKRMKRGKGVGIDKVSSEMLLGGGRNAVA